MMKATRPAGRRAPRFNVWRPLYGRWFLGRLPGVLGIGLLVLAWHLASLRYSPLLLPSPGETLSALFDLAREGKLTRAIADTGTRTLTGLAWAVIAGGSLGLIAGLFPAVRAVAWPIVSTVQGVPPIAWIVLTLIWFGTGGRPVVFTVAAVTLPIVFVAMVEGVRSSDPDLSDMAKNFGASPWVTLVDIYIPQVISYAFPAVITAAAIGWKAGVMAEVLGAQDGIGSGLTVARVNLDTPTAMAWVLAMVVILLAFEYLVLHPLKAWLEPWRPERRSAASTPGEAR